MSVGNAKSAAQGGIIPKRDDGGVHGAGGKAEFYGFQMHILDDTTERPIHVGVQHVGGVRRVGHVLRVPLRREENPYGRPVHIRGIVHPVERFAVFLCLL